MLSSLPILSTPAEHTRPLRCPNVRPISANVPATLSGSVTSHVRVCSLPPCAAKVLRNSARPVSATSSAITVHPSSRRRLHRAPANTRSSARDRNQSCHCCLPCRFEESHRLDRFRGDTKPRDDNVCPSLGWHDETCRGMTSDQHTWGAMHPAPEKLRDMLRLMQTIRRFEERASADYLAGKIYGVVHCYIGEEAVAVGVCARPQSRRPDHLRRIAATATASPRAPISTA